MSARPGLSMGSRLKSRNTLPTFTAGMAASGGACSPIRRRLMAFPGSDAVRKGDPRVANHHGRIGVLFCDRKVKDVFESHGPLRRILQSRLINLRLTGWPESKFLVHPPVA